MPEQITINRGLLRHRLGVKFHYTVIVPGEKYHFSGDGLSWARDLARRYAKPGQKIVENWVHDRRTAMQIYNEAVDKKLDALDLKL